tara:strand:+ start:100 stop:594 length:495 start_codon:yes stop_codon:yes gene_type:complete
MREDERLKLDELLRKDDVAQTTNQIRQLKHSGQIKMCIDNIVKLKTTHNRMSKDMFEKLAIGRANFLFSNYTQIFNKLINDEINVRILYEFVAILKQIEDGHLNQHEGSYMVGKKLKELYVDSVVEKDKKERDKDAVEDAKKAAKIKKPKKKINYKQFRMLQEN